MIRMFCRIISNMKMRRNYVLCCMMVVGMLIIAHLYASNLKTKNNALSSDFKLRREGTVAHVMNTSNSFVVNVHSNYTMVVHTNTSFLDLRKSKRATLRMFGYLETSLPNHHRLPLFKCHLTRNGVTSSVTGRGYVITNIDQPPLRGVMNRTAQFICDLPFEAGLEGVSVILHGTFGDISVVKRIGTKLNTIPKPKGFAICLPTLYNLYSPYIFSEWIEVQRLLGVSKVFLYDKFNIAPEVDQILNHYANTGFLKIVHWNQPWRTAQFAHGHNTVLNHCLYSLMEEFEYIGVYDLDEYLIPTVKKVGGSFMKIYPDLMDLVTASTSRHIAAYSFWRKQMCVPYLNATDQQSLRFTKSFMSRPGMNFKTIIRPQEITVLSIHEPFVFLHGIKRIHIAEKYGQIYHYKVQRSLASCNRTDKSVLVYSDVVKSAIKGTFKAAGIPYK